MKSLVLRQTSQIQIEEEILNVFLKAINFIQINVLGFGLNFFLVLNQIKQFVCFFSLGKREQNDTVVEKLYITSFSRNNYI